MLSSRAVAGVANRCRHADQSHTSRRGCSLCLLASVVAVGVPVLRRHGGTCPTTAAATATPGAQLPFLSPLTARGALVVGARSEERIQVPTVLHGLFWQQELGATPVRPAAPQALCCAC